MTFDTSRDISIALLRDISLRLVRGSKPNNLPDFTVRQLAMLTTIYTEPAPHTVKGLANALGVAKPVVTRALDAMTKHGFVHRRRDESDRRNVIVQRTAKGAMALASLAGVCRGAVPEAAE
jgi:DNA-binding MarR family transcriptional regulator